MTPTSSKDDKAVQRAHPLPACLENSLIIIILHSPDNGPQQSRSGFIMERDNYGSRWQVLSVSSLAASVEERETKREREGNVIKLFV